MIAKFRISPATRTRMSKDMAQVIEVLETVGLSYELSPMGTTVRGSWEEIMEAIGICHRLLGRQYGRIVTTIEINDCADSEASLVSLHMGEHLSHSANT